MSGILRQHLALARAAPGIYERECDRTWWGHEALFGGYVQALVLSAMADALGEPDKPAQSMHMHFMRPFSEGFLRIETEVVRRGRTMADTACRAYSQGKLAGIAMANFATRRPVAEFRQLTPPAELDELGRDEPPSEDVFVPTHDYYEFYPRIGTFRRGAGGEARVGGFMRQRYPDPVDEALMFVLADNWMPAAYRRWESGTPAVTADITTHFRTALPRLDLPAATPLFVELRTAGSIGGFVDEDVTIWTPAGELLAQSRQMRYALT